MVLTMQAQGCAVFQFNNGIGVTWEDLEDNSQKSAHGYVDLGLPSGTLWKATNENGLYDYNTAVSNFGDKLPSQEQWSEIKDYCKWDWYGSGYKVTGENGRSILLPAAGFRDENGDVDCVGSYGFYWSSSMTDNYKKSWSLIFDMNDVVMGRRHKYIGMSVRLVQD